MSEASHPDSPQKLSEELLQEFSARLVSVFETMAGEKPAAEINANPDAPATGSLLWKQPLSGLDGALWLASVEADWTAAGLHILQAAGLGPEDTDPDSIRSSYLETLSQALGGLAQNISSRAGREVTPIDGKAIDDKDGKAAEDGKAGEDNDDNKDAPGGGNQASAPGHSAAHWGSITLTLGGTPAVIFLGIENQLLESLTKLSAASQAGDSSSSSSGEQSTSRAAAAGQSLAVGGGAGSSGQMPNGQIDDAAMAAGKSKTFDLLLDVELPVSVSFGSAEVSLKDVLKLTSGSIIELNRTIQEPVEVVVNNCVIARGEVVVVEGNFGVRIQSVASRQERLRTLR